jgi:hypothetical protein
MYDVFEVKGGQPWSLHRVGRHLHLDLHRAGHQLTGI